MSANNVKKIRILKRMILKPGPPNNLDLPGKSNHNINNQVLKLSAIPLYREDIIFASNGESFLPGEYHRVTITNKLNNITNSSQTLATCVTHNGEVIEKTSDKLTQLIGQEAYNILFYALCSVINQEYRIKAILALLTGKGTEVSKQPSNIKIACMGTNEKSCQTDETRLETIKHKINRRRVRKVLSPYVVKPDEARVKKVIINPVKPVKSDSHCTVSPDLNFEPFKGKLEVIDTEQENISESVKSLPDLGYLHDDNSNDSTKTFLTINTFKTTSDLLVNPISLVDNVDKYTKEQILPNHMIMLSDGQIMKVPFKPEDDFHIASKENLQYLDETNRKKLLFHQMQIDYKACLSSRDEDGNLPIHLAVINEDIELLKRQCVVLKIRNQSVDITANNGLTALKLSLFQDSTTFTNILLQHGADPFLADEEHSTAAHLTAELKTDHLAIILNHCKLKARDIIIQHTEELQKPGWEKKTDEQLSSIVLHHICSLFDKQGYTPLMLASKLGHYENVRLLVESAPESVNLTMPTSGNTALFLAIAAASCDSAERGNKSKVVDQFRKTIEILLEAGADPSIDNNSGSNVNLLLQEFNCAELSMLVANKVTTIKYFNGEEDHTRNFDKFVLMRDGNNISIQEMSKRTSKKGKKITATGNKKVTKKVSVTKELDVTIKEEKKTKELVVTIKEENKTKEDVTNVSDNVTKEVKNVTTMSTKPVITQNILLKTPLKINDKANAKVVVDKNVNSKDFVIKPMKNIETVSNVKKVIWFPLKRKLEELKDVKKCKIKK